MTPSFDVVVVGSGYGGAVVAAQLSAQGQTVCVLERGTAFPPGAFPRTPDAVADAVWLPDEKRLGLFDVRRLGPIDVVQTSGLGGGSLIGSGVLARPRALDADWPITLADLEPHFERAEAALRGTPFPLNNEPHAPVARPRAMIEAARQLGAEHHRPLLAIAFTSDGQALSPGAPIMSARANPHRRRRYACRLVGECNVGCNYGAKESLDYTCLSAALSDGAVLRIGCDVQKVRPVDGGYEVQFDNRLTSAPTSPVPLASSSSRVRGKRVVLAAGAIGTTSLLLLSRKHLPALSKRVGERLGTNGEQLAVATGCGVTGPDGARTLIDGSHGPATTTVLSFAQDGDPPVNVHDIGYPDFLAWISPLLGNPDAEDGPAHLRVLRRAYAAVTADAPAPPSSGWPDGTIGLLVLGGPAHRGVLRRRSDGVEIEWAADREGDDERAARALERARQVANALGGALITGGFARQLCLHPLGGCSMGESAENGVVDSFGRVFGCPGLYVADASIFPGPVRMPPGLTIAALANRVAMGILDDQRAAPPTAVAG